jgi:hypothetical protein
MTAIHDDKKLHFDLNLLEFALRKTIEICNAESEILTKIADINVETLEEIYEEKEDLMNFIVDLFSLKMRIMMRNFEEYEESLIFNLLYIFQEK